MSKPVIRVFPDLERMSWEALWDFVAESGSSDRYSVALSGGTTPQRFYQLLPTREDIEWRKVHLFYGDDRYVHPSDPRSNELMVREAVDNIDIPVDHLHPIYTDDGWQESADWYEKVLRQFFQDSETTFSLALQGMGEDGHTASLFPGQPLTEPGRWVVTRVGPPDTPERISLTVDFLARAELVRFMVAGEGKAQKVKEILEDGNTVYPAGALSAAAGNVEWWLDQAAASLLT